MSYVNRKDGGKFIPTKFEKSNDIDYDRLIEIGYNKDVADYAAKVGIKYREAFIQAHKQAKQNEQAKTEK